VYPVHEQWATYYRDLFLLNSRNGKSKLEDFDYKW
jgi:hypothetical protein